MIASIASTAHSAAGRSPSAMACAMYEPRPGSWMSRFITLMASLCATKNQPPPNDIIEFQIRLWADAGNSSVRKRCHGLSP